MKNCFSILLCLLVLSLFQSTVAAEDKESLESILDKGHYDKAAATSIKTDHYLAELIREARNKELHQHPVWHALMHYKKRFLIGLESEVDSFDFFLSDTGKSDSQAELEATLAAFFSSKPVEPSKYSPQCRFPARFLWLKKQLQFNEQKIAFKPCEDLKQYYEAMDPESLTVIFPSTHPNSPSSMFGHTLLRVNKKNQTEETRMLAFSINYAAQIDPEEDMLSYTVFGLTGGFAGKFMVLPYYVKLREYAQIENRDLWEYDLKLPPEDLEFVLMHTFELAYSYFDYYFFTENCSYHLLSLLDILHAEDRMTDEFAGWTIPVDTLKVMAERGLIKDARFYPSLAGTINQRRSQMNDHEQQLVLDAERHGIDYSINHIKQLEPERQVKVLDLLTDYLRYQKIEDSETKVSSKLSHAERKVLLHRSKLKLTDGPLVVEQSGVSPEQGHDTSRIGTATGLINDINYVDIEWRPAYHDILDSSQGFVSNSGLEFMKLKLRYLPDTNEAQLQQVSILNIESLEPRDNFFSGFSWHTTVGWEKVLLDTSEKWHDSSYFNAGTGVAYELSPNFDSMLYAYIDMKILLGGGYEDNYSFLPGLSAGYIVEPVQGWRLNLTTNYYKGVLGDKLTNYQVNLSQSFTVSHSVNVRLNLAREKFSNLQGNKVEAQLFYYF